MAADSMHTRSAPSMPQKAFPSRSQPEDAGSFSRSSQPDDAGCVSPSVSQQSSAALAALGDYARPADLAPDAGNPDAATLTGELGAPADANDGVERA